MFDFTQARHHMVDSQIRPSDVTDLSVLRAFRSVAREAFVPKAQQALAYSDAHIDMGNGRCLIRPRDFAKMVQAAEIQSTDIVLDIACGRGYSSAILSHLADTVVGLEDNEERVNRATDNLVDAQVMNAAIVQGPLKVGAAEHGPFDVIFVNGAVEELSAAWASQLTHNGRLVVVIQNGPIGQACLFTRSGEATGQRILFDTSLPILDDFKRAPEFVL